ERHCNLTLRGERAFVRDLDSRTGTFLNDRQLRGEIELRDGDFLRVGPLVFIIQLETSAAAERLLPEPLAAETQEMPAYVPETQEMPACVPEPELPPEAGSQEMPNLEPDSSSPTEAALAAVGSTASVNGVRPLLARTPWGRRRRQPRPAT